MATPAYLVGKVVAVSVGGTLMYATRSDYTRSVNVVKVTNARSGGFQEVKPGIKMASGSCEVVYNGDDKIDIVEGVELVVIWTPTGGTTRTFTALVSSVREGFVVDGDYTYSFDWTSSGSYS